MISKKLASFALREGTAILMLCYIIYHVFWRNMAPENPGQAMFETAIIIGIYIWCQDTAMAAGAHTNPSRVLVDTLVSSLPFLLAIYGLVQHARGIDPLAEHNVRVLVLAVLFTAKDVILGLMTAMRLLFLSDDVKGTFTAQT